MAADGSLTGVGSLPIFIELKNDVDSIMTMSDNSLSQQIEFILQDSNPEKTPPHSSEYLTALVSSQYNGAVDDIHHYQLMDSSDIKIEPLLEEDTEQNEDVQMFDSTNTDVDSPEAPFGAAVVSEEVNLCNVVVPSTPVNTYATTQRGVTIANPRRSQRNTTATRKQYAETVLITKTPNAKKNNKAESVSQLPKVNMETLNQKENSVPEFRYECTICAEKFTNKELFEIHKTGHANNMKCAICNMVLKSLKNYEKHCLRCSPYECQICGRVVRFRPNFIKHMRVHTGQQSERHKYQCEECGKEFMSFEYFKVHKKIHNADIDLTCTLCGKLFSALASLRGHSKLHSGLKLHKCEVCGKGFGQRYNLKIHSRIHTGEFPFECKVCKKKLHTQSSFKNHMQTHKKDQTSQVTTTIKYETPVISKIQIVTPDQKNQYRNLEHQELLRQHKIFIQPKQKNTKVYSRRSNGTTALKISVGSNNIVARNIQTSAVNNKKTNVTTDNFSHDANMIVINNDVQKVDRSLAACTLNSPDNQRQRASIIRSTSPQQTQPSPSSTVLQTSLPTTSITSLRSANINSPSLAVEAIEIKSEPILYSSADNSVDMFIKKELIFDDCTTPPNNVQAIAKFHSSFDDDDFGDTHDLTNSLQYSNFFEPHSIPDTIPDELYPNSDEFQMSQGTLPLQSSTTDGDFIKKEWVYGTGSGYSVCGKFDDDSDILYDPANFI